MLRVAFLKSFAVGTAALVIYIALLAAYPFLSMWWQSRRTGAGGIGVVFISLDLVQFIVGLVVFASAFWWEFRRAS
jgi:hypothetical protein